jgi:cytoskeleton protein RodZ
MSPLGPDLKSARETKGISLEEIAAATRISLKFLKALEEDNYAVFPSEFFARSVIRAFARAVGLDEKEVLERYRELGLKAGRRPPLDAAPRPPAAGRGRSFLWNTAFLLFSAAVVALTLFVFLKHRGGRPPSPPAAVSTGAPTETPAESRPAPTAPVPSAPSAAETAPPAAGSAAVQGLLLELSFNAETWIQVYADGATKLDGLEPAGVSFRIEARSEILINIGNAGGVGGLLNGRPLKPFGASGAVIKNIRMTPDNLADFWK